MQREEPGNRNVLLYSQAEQIAIDFINSHDTLDDFIAKYPEKNFSRATLAVLKSNNKNPMANPVRDVLSVMGMEMNVKRTILFIIYKSIEEPSVITYDKALALAIEILSQSKTIDEFISKHPHRDYKKQTLVMLRSDESTPYPRVVQQILSDAGYTVTINKDHLFIPIEDEQNAN